MKKITKFLAAILIFAAVTANAGNPVGTLNLTRQGQTVTGNNGDVQFAFGGVLATQSGFNYNPTTFTLSVDSVPVLNGVNVVTVDTTVTDTVRVLAGYLNIINATGVRTVVVVLPYLPVNKTVGVRFTGNTAAVTVIVRRISDYAALYGATQYLNPNEWKFGWAGQWY